MTAACPYCGGDESKCNFDNYTDQCAEMTRHHRAKDLMRRRKDDGTAAADKPTM